MLKEEDQRLIGEVISGAFMVTDDHTLTPRDEDKPGGGPQGRYVTLEFNTALHVAGDGDFSITVFHEDESKPWIIVDYVAE